MTNRMPKFLDRRKICVICEGAEEYEYLERLNTLNVWSKQYKVILDNADGNGNIPARYQDRYQNSSYDLVLVFCDTEKKPYEQYVDIKRKINEFHGVNNVADNVVIYGNPCTMQIILQHWCEEKLKTPSKKVNSSLIQQCTGVENYKGRADQRKQIMEQITLENFGEMKERIKQMEDDDRIIGSSNFARFIEFLTNEDDGWIEKINTLLDV